MSFIAGDLTRTTQQLGIWKKLKKKDVVVQPRKGCAVVRGKEWKIKKGDQLFLPGLGELIRNGGMGNKWFLSVLALSIAGGSYAYFGTDMIKPLGPV